MKREKRDGVGNRAARKGALGPVDLFVLSFGAMLGWSWVVLSGEWILSAGIAGTVLALALGGVFVLFVGMVYAELTAAMPQSEGVLLFGQRAFGKNAAFLGAWAVTLGFLSVICFEAVALPSVAAYLFPQYPVGFLYRVAGFEIHATWLAVGMLGSVAIMVLNYRGARMATILQTLLTALVVGIGLAFFAGGAASEAAVDRTPLFQGGAGGMLSVLVMTPFVLSGFDVIPQMAGETAMPAKRIGQMLVLSVATAVVWYVLISCCVGNALGKGEIAASLLPTADAMARVFGGGRLASDILVAGGIAGILACWNAFYMGASRSICAMAREGLLPAALGKAHPKYNTPSNAILLVGIISTLAPLLGKNMLTWMANAGSFATVVTYLVVALCYLRLRRREPNMPRPFAVRRWRLVGGMALALCLGMLVLYLPGSPSALQWPYEWGIVLFWSLLGATLSFAARKRSLAGERDCRMRTKSFVSPNDENEIGEC